MVFIWQLLHALLLLVLEFYPYPELIIYPYLRSLGWLPYAQILDQHFPGLLFFPINLHTLGFTDPRSLHMLLILIVLVESFFVYKIGRHWLAVAFFTSWQPFFEGNQLWIDTFLALFTLPAWLLFSKKKWFASGLVLGLGIVFKQTLIPLVIGCGLYLLWQYWRRAMLVLIPFVLGAVLPSLLMLAYLGYKGVWSDFWFWAVKFNLTGYAQGGRLAPTWGQWLILSWPLAVVALSWWKRLQLRLAIGWLLASIIGAVARFGFIHLQPAVPFFCLVYSDLVITTWRKSRLWAVVLVIPTLIWTGRFYLHQSNWLDTHFYSPADLQLVQAISARVVPGEKIFLLGVNPHIYQLTGTVPPGQVFVFQFPWFLQVAGDRVLTGIKRDRPRLIVYDATSVIDGQYLKDYAHYLVEYTQRNYQPVQQLGSVTIYANRN